MRFRTKILLLAIFALITALVLWLLPTPRIIISPEGTKTEHPYWWWLAGSAFVIFGCVFECVWMTGFKRLDLRFTQRQKLAVGMLLIGVIFGAISYTVFQLHR